MADKNGFCPCGFPQSSPIPHEHDQTDREKAIIKHFEDQQRITPEIVIEITDGMACLTLKSKGVQVTFIDSCNYYREQFRGEYYDNNNLKGKKMSNVFNVLAIQEHTDKLPTILVPITTVIAEDESRAKLTFAVENAAELKDKENVLILARPFC